MGTFYLTMKHEEMPADRFTPTFASEADALLAYWSGQLDIHEPIKVRLPKDGDGEELEIIEITVGRLIFNSILPPNLRYIDKEVDKKTMQRLVTDCYEKNGHERTVIFLDDIKDLGFRYATFAGMTISMTDTYIPSLRDEIVDRTQASVARKNRDYTAVRLLVRTKTAGAGAVDTCGGESRTRCWVGWTRYPIRL